MLKQKIINKNLRKEFPIFKKNNLIYLDSAATTQKPKIVINRINEFYSKQNSNTHRGIYKLSEEATILVENSRKKFAKFLNANNDEIIFTRNTTEGINNISRSIIKLFNKNENIVTTELEHHSNFVPWQKLSKEHQIEFRILEFDFEKDDFEDLKNKIDSNTKIFSITGMSNVTGKIIDLKKIIINARLINPKIIIIIDAAQLIAHKKINVKELDCDFLCFSIHKLYGPNVGIIYGKKILLEKIDPFLYGGNMINNVNVYESTWAEIPEKFEAGTLDGAGIIGAEKALDFFEENFEHIGAIEYKLKNYALNKLKKIPEIKILGHKNNEYGGVISFSINNLHPHDIATICDSKNVCIRAGNHCAQILHKKLNLNSTSRISFGAYNTKKDINEFINALEYAIKILKKQSTQ